MYIYIQTISNNVQVEYENKIVCIFTSEVSQPSQKFPVKIHNQEY